MGSKEHLTISCIGHKKLHKIYKFNEKVTRSEIYDYLEQLKDNYSLSILTKWENGACELFVEEALKLDITPIFIISKKHKKSFDKHFKNILRLYNYAGVVMYYIFTEESADNYLIDEGDKILCLWNGDVEEKEITPTVIKAKLMDKQVIFF